MMQKLGCIFLLFLLLVACGKSPKQARRELGELGVDYNKESFQEAVVNRDPVAVDLFLIAGMDPSPVLAQAVIDEDLELVKKFLNQGADPNYDNGIALYQAVNKGNNEIIKLLLDKGANPNLKANPVGLGYISPLAEASANGNLGTVKFLIDRGANPNDGEQGNSDALLNAIRSDRVEVVKFLLERGANPNSTTNTPLPTYPLFSFKKPSVETTATKLAEDKPEISELLEKASDDTTDSPGN